ncbi:Retrovirus-related Pol polyprotein from transposon opus [Vitis vinifera]|uniref:Retrovirus-related Pol polyprotein from transposon opus n=1 Tax=Vitis vinifera TaxID=29760 RepID=A0A438HY46_VITVI|nr:Retrovirus-related Pol polyprotein from transposon opus [Vitis vinifera]
MSNTQSQGLPTSTQCKRKESFLLNLIKIPRVSMKWRLKGKIFKVLRQVKVNIPLLDMIKQVPTYARFLKNLCTVKGRLNVNKKAFLIEQVNAIIQCKSPVKYKYLGCLTILVSIGGTCVEKVLLDLGANRSVKIPRGMIEDVLVQVDKFYYPVDFVVLDTDPFVKGTNYVPIILGRPLLATSNAIINCRNGVMQLTFGNMILELNIFHLFACYPVPLEEETQRAAKEEPLKLILKPLPTELKCKKAIGWQIYDLKWISTLVCTHHIYMEDEAKSVCQPQRRLNPHMQEVVQAEVLKLLQVGIIYPISDSPWVSPTQVVPKKSRITVMQNDKGEEVSTCLTTGWRVCIDYRRLNAVARKDHFPLPFIDQVLERVSGHPFYCLLDGYSEYFQIEIDVEDQEKTTFTCPFGIYAYRRMLFDLCNSPTTFQRCMLSIFSDMVERIMEVFMDDITIYGSAWIILGHIISKQDIEVDKAKVELIVKLPSPTNVKGVRQFLGHARFYKRFIKDFSKLARSLCELSVKDAKFIWDDRCQRSFEELKLFLTTAPIVRAPNWQLPFEVMCDANNFAIGVVLGQREDGKPYVIYYASKTLNEAQRNYTTTEKELLAIVFALDKFRAYLVGSFIVVFTDHSALKQERSGDVVPDHLSRLAIAHNTHGMPINDDFPEESLTLVEVAPWYTHIANYLVIGEVLIPCKHNDHRVVLKFLKENIFSRFGMPKVIISDGGTHFCNKPFETLLAKYGVKHKVATPYHPQTSGQVELAN